jgi:hypothetical protein
MGNSFTRAVDLYQGRSQIGADSGHQGLRIRQHHKIRKVLNLLVFKKIKKTSKIRSKSSFDARYTLNFQKTKYQPVWLIIQAELIKIR